jgi:hypothetical protein
MKLMITSPKTKLKRRKTTYHEVEKWIEWWDWNCWETHATKTKKTHEGGNGWGLP